MDTVDDGAFDGDQFLCTDRPEVQTKICQFCVIDILIFDAAFSAVEHTGITGASATARSRCPAEVYLKLGGFFDRSRADETQTVLGW